MATRTSVATGNWSAAGTWDTKPAAGDDVIIADGHIVTLDEDASIASVTAAGNTGYITSAVSTTLTLSGNGIVYGGTLTAGFIRQTANTLAIVASGTPTTLISASSSGTAVATSSTGTVTVNNSTRTACALTGSGKCIAHGSSSTSSTVTGNVTSNSSGTAIAVTNGTVSVTGNITTTGTDAYGMLVSGGATGVLTGLPLHVGAVGARGAIRSSNSNITWTGTHTISAGQTVYAVGVGTGTWNMTNLVLQNSGNVLLYLGAATNTLTGASFTNMAATGQIVELVGSVITITGPTIPTEAQVETGVDFGYADALTGELAAGGGIWMPRARQIGV